MLATQPLDTIDQRLIALVSQQLVHTAELARRARTPYTQVQYRLARLHRRGFVTKKRLGNKTVWKSRTRMPITQHRMQVYSGRDFLRAYHHLLRVPKNTVMIAHQSNKAAFYAQRDIPAHFIKEVHRTLRRKRIKMIGFIHRDHVSFFDQLDNAMLESHMGRTMGPKMLSTIGGEAFSGCGEICLTPTLALMVNARAHRAVVIKDPHITRILYESFRILFTTAELTGLADAYDLNGYLRALLEKRKQKTDS